MLQVEYWDGMLKATVVSYIHELSSKGIYEYNLISIKRIPMPS
jgi:hypothetical protein